MWRVFLLSYSDLTAMNPGAITAWTRVGGRVTAPANTASMEVQYLLYMSSGWVNIDDVEVTAVSLASSEVTKYYYFGGQRIAMRKNGVLTYLHGDHLGSTVLETNALGAVTADEKYRAYGKQRDTGAVSTDHRFTGQKEDGSGLQYFNARFYDPVIGMFVSPDTIVPDAGNVFAYNRTMYVLGNPLRYNDPTGYYSNDEIQTHFGCGDWDCVLKNFRTGGEFEGLYGWLYILQQASNGDVIEANQGGQASTMNTGRWTRESGKFSGVFQRSIEGKIDVLVGGTESGYAEAVALFAKGGTPDGTGWRGYQLTGSKNVWTGIYANHEPGACAIWDCTALGYDVAAIGGSSLMDVSLAGEVFTGGASTAGVIAGATINRAATVAGLVHTYAGYPQGNSTMADLAVNSVTAALNPIPVVGTFAGVVQLGWDLIDPLHPW